MNNRTILNTLIQRKKKELIIYKQRLDFIRNNNCLFDRSLYNPKQEVRQTRAEYLEKVNILQNQINDLEKKLKELV